MPGAPKKWRWFSASLDAEVESARPPICDGVNDRCD